MEKRLEVGWLYDFYGPLLTEHRRELLRLYCEEDLSLGEIAQETGISRQGVYDAVRAARTQLEAYEDKLGMLARYKKVEQAVKNCREALERIDGAQRAVLEARAALDGLEDAARS